ncbi:MAG: hypothetical protein MSIBF_01980 [Candidatus Altiarchaeales archaeon IMC4]|nr:MAG: hypothetical protein MSIBF_01980 [Candidatus Altiarchaeales archaeon IMC4]
MRLMIFCDLQNFREGIIKCVDDRTFIEYWNIHRFVLEFIKNVLKWKVDEESIIRTYVYTGEYTTDENKKIAKHLSTETDTHRKQKIQESLDAANRGYEHQQNFFKSAKAFNFFEICALPLKYDYDNIRLFQKGVDVQLAVDVVSHAYMNNYDTAIICTGDIDLVKSVERVKLLGKRVIVVAHPDNMSQTLHKEGDYFLNVAKLTKDDLKTFTCPEKEMYDAVCSTCGEKCKVPFMPVKGKHISCKKCFKR